MLEGSKTKRYVRRFKDKEIEINHMFEGSKTKRSGLTIHPTGNELGLELESNLKGDGKFN